ncbi:MAG: 4-alpha-glucanotransferase [Methylobacteriaceae bacterium]|nr:4-alpha-glucanotransferase [Methylobacteriaceae bacterium]
MVATRSVVILAEAEGQGAPPSRRGVAPDLLAQLASAAGIAGQWWDLTGSLHTVPDETSRMLIEGMGLAAGSNAQARESLLRLSEAHDGRAVPHALVVRENQPVEIRLAVPARPLSLRLEREDGSVERFFYVEGNLRPIQISSADGRTREARVAIVPPQPVGRHRLRLEDHADLVCELTVAPARCHLPPAMAEGGRFFGIAAHLYALRRHGDQGIGDFTTLGRLGELAAAEGAATIGLNPLHALFPTDRAQASPYHPSDRRFLDPIYIDIATLNDLPQPPDPKSFGNEAAALTAGPMVDYRRVWALKSAALQRSFAAFDALLLHRAPEHVLAQAFRAFVERQGPALQRFACFETLAELRPGEPWASWPAGLREAWSPEVEAFAQAHQERLRFHSFLQWLGDRQLATVAARAATSGLRLGLYRDLAVGAAPEGAEAWAEAAHLIGTASIGAPPDPFSAEGQIWHLPALNPLTLAASNYLPFVASIAANMRHAGALRIDHAMGLARLFLVPAGARASEGAYVAYPLEDLLGQLALESVRHGCAVVGEDLGTVPEGFRERLAAADVLSYRVLWFERAGAGFKPPSKYTGNSVACVSTHDLPTLAGWWACDDIAERLGLGRITPAEAERERIAREEEKTELAAALREAGLIAARPRTTEPLTADFAASVHAYLASGASRLVLVQADDLAGEMRGINLPGTDKERPNWRRRIGKTIDDLFAEPAAKLVLRKVREARTHKTQ